VPAELLTPDAHAHDGLLLLVPEVARNAERLAIRAAEELRHLDPKRRAAPGAIAKLPVDLFGAAATLGHEDSFQPERSAVVPVRLVLQEELWANLVDCERERIEDFVEPPLGRVVPPLRNVTDRGCERQRRPFVGLERRALAVI
jgi:hypothetical protein